MTNVSPEQLRRAADLAEQIQSLQSELDQILVGLVPSPTGTAEPKTRKMSAAGRAAISAAAKARWAKIRAKKGLGQPKAKRGRKMSAKAKAKLSRIAKARWTEARKAGKSKL